MGQSLLGYKKHKSVFFPEVYSIYYMIFYCGLLTVDILLWTFLETFNLHFLILSAAYYFCEWNVIVWFRKCYNSVYILNLEEKLVTENMFRKS